MEIYLIRHAQTQWNIEERLQGWSDSPLSKEGIEEAEKMAKTLGDIDFDHVYSSDLRRARRSAEILVKNRDLKITYTPALRELALGTWEGKCFEEVKRDFPREMEIYFTKPALHNLEGCENYHDLEKRIQDFLDHIGKKNHRRILVVGHGVSVQAILNKAEGIGLEDFWKNPLVRGMDLSLLSYRNKELKILQRARQIEGKSY